MIFDAFGDSTGTKPFINCSTKGRNVAFLTKEESELDHREYEESYVRSPKEAAAA